MNGALLGSKLCSKLISAAGVPPGFNGRTKQKLLWISTRVTDIGTHPTKGDFTYHLVEPPTHARLYWAISPVHGHAISSCLHPTCPAHLCCFYCCQTSQISRKRLWIWSQNETPQMPLSLRKSCTSGVSPIPRFPLLLHTCSGNSAIALSSTLTLAVSFRPSSLDSFPKKFILSSAMG